MPTRGLREAELTKLLENTYRQVNIALVNEMALFCAEAGIDMWDVVRSAATKPFGFQSFEPGPGVGGHCIPIDPSYLMHFVRENGAVADLVETALRVNRAMPDHVAARALTLLRADGSAHRSPVVLLIGVTFKADVADCRETPAANVLHGLRARGAQVIYHDPYVPSWDVDGSSLVSTDLADGLARADLVVVLAHHTCVDFALVAARARRILDTRGRLAGPRVVSL